MEFMVHIKNNFPPDENRDLFANLMVAETARAKELVDAEILRHLWKRPGQRTNVGIWASADATSLHESLSSLPFFPWLEIEVWPLAAHPNFPTKDTH